MTALKPDCVVDIVRLVRVVVTVTVIVTDWLIRVVELEVVVVPLLPVVELVAVCCDVV